ncbi:MAG: hypothetical protein BAJATHORv1_20249 [Candidatus Thorarchaeota archaeon]|nr:MAG: hypothetical protein BAJATHORv1_20249 [Candidatus Thorarchaeota archaeon]
MSKKASNNQEEPKLSDISGVGPKLQKSLIAAGIDSVEKLAIADPAMLAEDVDGVGAATAKKIVKAAKKLAPSKKKKTSKSEKKSKKTKKPPKKSITEQIIDELIVELQSADQQIALGAVDQLAKIEGDLATECLVDCLEDKRYMIRLHAAMKLGDRQDKRAIEGLIETLSDESLFVRQTAAGALESIGGAKATKAIKKAEKEGLLMSDLPKGRKL